jgi:uncharacterized HAD superfamily protein/hypoxanthine phosphoribosyltransferase
MVNGKLMNYKSISDLSVDIRENLFKIQNTEYDLVVGLPRSGMIPAYIIALHLNVDCTDIRSYIDNKPLKKGGTRKARKNLSMPHDAKNILVVDDSIGSGKSMKDDLMLISNQAEESVKITTLAIYSSELKRTDVHIFLKYLPYPRVFEWNIFHHDLLSKSCLDIDGVLCIDPTEEENDDGEKYRFFILNAKPLFLPTSKVHSLVTSRLIKYKKETEQWLAKYNVLYDYLIMLDLPSKEERQALGIHGKHKAHYYKNSATDLFVESEEGQAKEICKITGKPVYCVDNNTMYNENLINELKSNSKSINKYSPIFLIKHFLRPLKRFILKKIYHIN